MKLKQTIIGVVGTIIGILLAIEIVRAGIFLSWRGHLQTTCESLAQEIIDYRSAFGILPDRREDLDTETVSTLPDDIEFIY